MSPLVSDGRATDAVSKWSLGGDHDASTTSICCDPRSQMIRTFAGHRMTYLAPMHLLRMSLMFR